MRSSSQPAVLLRIMVLAAMAALILPLAASQSSRSGYHLTNTIKIGGEGTWDYLTLDPDARRLYISHDKHVLVFDPDTEKVVGDIAGAEGVHGIAVVRELGRGFFSNGRANTVTIFDLSTLKPIGTVKSTGENPDSIVYDPASRRVFTFNGHSGTATAIDAAKGQVAGSIDLGGGKPEFSAADGRGHVYVNVEDKNITIKMDSRQLKVESKWPLATCDEPAGMAIDREHHRLFVGCHNNLLMVLDSDSGHVVAKLPIGNGTDAIVFDPQSKSIFSSNRDGTLTFLREDSPDKYTVVDNIPTQKNARTMAFDAKTGRVFLVTADLGPTPAATPSQPRPRPAIAPGTFRVLVVEK